MKSFKTMAAQGDLMIIRVSEFDAKDYRAAQPEGGKFILAHSETGHHHTVPEGDVLVYEKPDNQFEGAMQVLRECLLTHERSFDTHDPIKLEPGNYKIRRQREYVANGYRRAAD